MRAAQLAGHVGASMTGHDLFLTACSITWIKGNGAEQESVGHLRTLTASGHRQRNAQA
ncbi:hypothetical protein ACFW93_40635 [Streptomyces canus]|uniref:hypothetical protein n=1 Tax=Streptomyces canus TaxID=58343 RepID=UPI003692D996